MSKMLLEINSEDTTQRVIKVNNKGIRTKVILVFIVPLLSVLNRYVCTGIGKYPKIVLN